jgi:hypothetical protein
LPLSPTLSPRKSGARGLTAAVIGRVRTKKAVGSFSPFFTGRRSYDEWTAACILAESAR